MRSYTEVLRLVPARWSSTNVSHAVLPIRSRQPSLSATAKWIFHCMNQSSCLAGVGLLWLTTVFFSFSLSSGNQHSFLGGPIPWSSKGGAKPAMAM